MTLIQCCDCVRCALSNYFAQLVDGIGKRGSSYMDVDAVTHDGARGRFLIQEFKHDGEPLSGAARWMLRDVARLPDHFTVWIVFKRDDAQIELWAIRPDCTYIPETITEDEYRARFRAWWEA